MKRLLKYFDIYTFGGAVFLTILFLNGCKQPDKTAEEVSKIQIDLDVIRFDREFASASAETIPTLKSKYPYLFPEQFEDSIWIAKLTDTIQVELSDEVDKTFGSFEQEKKDLESLFKHVTYYFPKFVTPKVVTVTSDVGYNNRVILTDTLLLLGLDNYLGTDHHFYKSIQRYIAAGLDKQYLTSDVASAIAKKVLKYPRDRSFIARMVYYGKELYIKDKVLPLTSDAQKIGYTNEEMEWATNNEEQIWRYFVEKELLYSTDAKLDRRFLEPAPFSKFQLELDSESPGRLGRYIGWQMVRAFMEKNNLTLQQLLNLPGDEIFKKSNYKPRK
ncbi:gliding motility lipoprotein GldB [Flagellimonas aquimarina]|uniref:Gliding motility lipoprotein GldB n=1 Tax=Flagellimonas aquimarina TaxID=2201895 RepID=A0A316KYE7_9FLAO|nr:gliding motility lipoprotein GldB [Allomuricauda koreensis]PWL37835.1 gliding motility lipoprotein GldB [Allomuricauda koreensis]